MDFREQLKQRHGDRISSYINNNQNNDLILATSSTDEGVVRNGGRRGARHGAQAILSQFKKMVAPQTYTFNHIEIASNEDEENNFETAQLNQVKTLKEIYQTKFKPTLHLGGGHDHAYPFIKSILETNPDKTIHLLNIDAHLDTRQDQLVHSGTPFRQLANEFSSRLKISQFGIHLYANTEKNFLSMPCEMNVYSKEQTTLSQLKEVISQSKNDWFVLSLDADGLDAMAMEAVSAVNHDGLSANLVSAIFDFYFQTIPRDQWSVGIYEYNPIFDNLSCKGARYLASLLYKIYS